MKWISSAVILTIYLISVDCYIFDRILDRFTKKNDETSTGRPEGWADCVEQDVDEYLDRVFAQARVKIPEPMRLPPRSSKSAFVDLSEGRVWGMNTLYRTGPAKVSCEGNDTAIIETTIAVDDLKGRYTWKKNIAMKEREGYIVLLTNDFRADMRIIIQMAPTKKVTLDEFDIKKMKDIRVEMTGMGFFTWALAEVSTMMSGVFQKAIANTVEGPLKEALERQMYEMELS